MHLTWHGQYTLKFQVGSVTIVSDPYSSETGLKPFKAKADYVVLTDPQSPVNSHVPGIQGEPIIINTPGEYSFQDNTLYAQAWRDSKGNERSIHRWHIEDMTILNLAGLEEPLDETALQELERLSIDILIVPVGGGESLNTKQAIDMVTTIEPRIAIPVHYKIPKLKEKLETVDSFINDIGDSTSSSQPKLNMTSKKLPTEGMEIIQLAP